MLKNEMESYVRIERRGLKNLMYPYMGVGWGGGKNCQNHPYVINEWSLTKLNYITSSPLEGSCMPESLLARAVRVLTRTSWRGSSKAGSDHLAVITARISLLFDI